MIKIKNRKIKRQMRQKRIRAKIFGTAETPRFSIFKSNKHFYIQLIDDNVGRTLSSVSDKEIFAERKSVSGGKNIKNNKAYELGKFAARKAISIGIKKVVFDRGGYKFHGSVLNIAFGAREGGLKF